MSIFSKVILLFKGDNPEHKRLLDTYSKMDNRLNLLFIGLLTAGILVFGFLLGELNQAIHEKHIYTCLLPKFIWYLIAMMITIIPLGFLYENYVKKRVDDFEDFKRYYKLRYSLPYVMGKLVALVVAIIALPVFILAVDTHTYFKEDNIEHNNFLGIGSTTYSYNDTDSIVQYKYFVEVDGEMKSRNNTYLYFSNGSSWNVQDYGFMNDDDNEKLIQFVEGKTGLERKFRNFKPN